MKQCYIKVEHELIPVSEEVYQAYTRFRENERYRARRDGKCGQSDYRRCSGDCATCPWQQEGYRVLSLDKAFGGEGECEKSEPAQSTAVDELVADKMLLENLYCRLDELIPDGAQVFRLRAQHYSEREIARMLGVKSQSTLNYRIRKWTSLSARIGTNLKICFTEIWKITIHSFMRPSFFQRG